MQQKLSAVSIQPFGSGHRTGAKTVCKTAETPCSNNTDSTINNTAAASSQYDQQANIVEKHLFLDILISFECFAEHKHSFAEVFFVEDIGHAHLMTTVFGIGVETGTGCKHDR